MQAEILEKLNLLIKKNSMINSTIRVKNARFWLPNYPADIIQKIIGNGGIYWDMQTLSVVDRYLANNAVICNVGAYIGSHSVFWGLERNAKKIYSFEPLPEAFEIMQENIKLNHLEDVVVPYNYGLYNVETNAVIESFSTDNMGATSFKPFPNGKFKLKRLDDVDIPEKIDLLKINVEGTEVEVLEGAKERIERDKPVIVLTSFHRKPECLRVLLRLKYKQAEIIRQNENGIFIPHESAL